MKNNESSLERSRSAFVDRRRNSLDSLGSEVDDLGMWSGTSFLAPGKPQSRRSSRRRRVHSAKAAVRFIRELLRKESGNTSWPMFVILFMLCTCLFCLVRLRHVRQLVILWMACHVCRSAAALYRTGIGFAHQVLHPVDPSASWTPYVFWILLFYPGVQPSLSSYLVV